MTMSDSPKTKNNKPWQLWAILLVTVVPMAGAYIAYFTGLGVPESQVNEGELLRPAKNVAELVETAEGDIPSFDENYDWRLLIPVTAQCNRACQQNLYVTRQVHIRLSEKADRLERYAVNLDGADGEAFLQSIRAEHPLLKTITVERQQWQQWLADTNVPADVEAEPYYLLVDQVGFAMMYYGIQHEGNQLLKDIKRVLRYSPEE